jgi:hypothetical protein
MAMVGLVAEPLGDPQASDMAKRIRAIPKQQNRLTIEPLMQLLNSPHQTSIELLFEPFEISHPPPGEPIGTMLYHEF